MFKLTSGASDGGVELLLLFSVVSVFVVSDRNRKAGSRWLTGVGGGKKKQYVHTIFQKVVVYFVVMYSDPLLK